MLTILKICHRNIIGLHFYLKVQALSLPNRPQTSKSASLILSHFRQIRKDEENSSRVLSGWDYDNLEMQNTVTAGILLKELMDHDKTTHLSDVIQQTGVNIPISIGGVEFSESVFREYWRHYSLPPEKPVQPKRFYKFGFHCFGKRQLKISMDRLQLLALFDRDLGWFTALLAIVLASLVSILGSIVLRLNIYKDIFAFIFCFVIAGSQYSLLKSVQPDAGSFVESSTACDYYTAHKTAHHKQETTSSTTPMLDIFKAIDTTSPPKDGARSMQDSFTSAIIPLSTDKALQDKYVTFLGHVRLGRLMEDMDLFAIVWKFDRKSNRYSEPPKLNFLSKLLIVHLICHYAVQLLTAIFINPEDMISVGLHERIGDCNEMVPVETVLKTLQKRKFLCAKNYDEPYYDFHCLPFFETINNDADE